MRFFRAGVNSGRPTQEVDRHKYSRITNVRVQLTDVRVRASPALPLAASLGMTFSNSVTIGIPTSIEIAKAAPRAFPVSATFAREDLMQFSLAATIDEWPLCRRLEVRQWGTID